MAGASSTKRSSLTPSAHPKPDKWPKLAPPSPEIPPQRNNSIDPAFSGSDIISSTVLTVSDMSVPPGASLEDTLKAIKDVQENPRGHKARRSSGHDYDNRGELLPSGLPVLPAAATAATTRTSVASSLGEAEFGLSTSSATTSPPPPTFFNDPGKGKEVGSVTFGSSYPCDSGDSLPYMYPMGTKERELEQMQRDGLLDADMSIEEASKKPWAALLDLKYGLPTGHPNSPSLTTVSPKEQVSAMSADATTDERCASHGSDDPDLTALPPPSLATRPLQTSGPSPSRKANIFKRVASAMRHPTNDHHIRESAGSSKKVDTNHFTAIVDHDHSDTEMTTSPAFTPTNLPNEPSVQTPLSEAETSSAPLANKGKLRGGQADAIVQTHQQTGYAYSLLTRDLGWWHGMTDRARQVHLDSRRGRAGLQLEEAFRTKGAQHGS